MNIKDSVSDAFTYIIDMNKLMKIYSSQKQQQIVNAWKKEKKPRKY